MKTIFNKLLVNKNYKIINNLPVNAMFNNSLSSSLVIQNKMNIHSLNKKNIKTNIELKNSMIYNTKINFFKYQLKSFFKKTTILRKKDFYSK